LCCVIVSFLVNMLFLKIKSELFIIRLFFPTQFGLNKKASKFPLALEQQHASQ
jgi:hypothetical protein